MYAIRSYYGICGREGITRAQAMHVNQCGKQQPARVALFGELRALVREHGRGDGVVQAGRRLAGEQRVVVFGDPRGEGAA